MKKLGPSLQLMLPDLPMYSLRRLDNGCWLAYQQHIVRGAFVSLCSPIGRLIDGLKSAAVSGNKVGESWTWTDTWGTEHTYTAESIKVQNHYAHVIYEEREHEMRDSVRSAWPSWIRGYEGTTNWLYPDTHRTNGDWTPLPTTGTGNQIGDENRNVSAFGLSLPWRVWTNGVPSEAQLADAPYATEAQVKAEWTRMKSKGLIGSGFAYKPYATLWLQQDVVNWLLDGKTDSNWASLVNDFPDAEKWPADSQLALMGMAWWMGVNFWEGWPKLTGYLRAQNFFGAAANAISKAKAPRDYEHQNLFSNSGAVAAVTGDRITLWRKASPFFVTNGGRAYLALKELDASLLASAPVATFDLTAWYAQSMLAKLGYYDLVIDGEFGPKSKAAYAAFCKSNTLPNAITKDSLYLLGQKAKWYLPTVS